MATDDKCCTIVPYIQVQPGKLDQFKDYCRQMVEKTSRETGVLFYGYSFDDHLCFGREGYNGAEAVLAHVENVSPLFNEAMELAELVRLELHGPAEELAKLKEPLADIGFEYFTLEYGFSRQKVN